MFATGSIERGALIVAFEKQPHVLVTRSHVAKARRASGRRVVSELRVAADRRGLRDLGTRSRGLETDQPLVRTERVASGLDLVGRRGLSPGEEITVDYADLLQRADAELPPRAAGAPRVAGTIHGDDYLGDVVARYEGHVSNYVARKRRELGLDC